MFVPPNPIYLNGWTTQAKIDPGAFTVPEDCVGLGELTNGMKAVFFTLSNNAFTVLATGTYAAGPPKQWSCNAPNTIPAGTTMMYIAPSA